MKEVIKSAAFASIIATVHAGSVVVPNDRATQSGNNSWVQGFASPGDFQMAYTARNFTQPVLITGMAFRLDEDSLGLSFDAVIPRITVRLTTYSGTPDSFNAGLYSANKGTDDTLVFDGSVTWHTADLPGSAPNPFDLAIPLSTPFAYDPSKGALLMSYFVPDSGGSRIFADFDQHNDPTIGWLGITRFPNSLSYGTLVTQFEVTNIPEPSVIWLLSSGIAVLCSVRVKRLQR